MEMSKYFRMRRAALVATIAAILPLAALAQAAWPERPIKLVVPFAPGASTDSVARLLASKLSIRLGQSVVVENKSGAGGSIGTDTVVKAQPDGYTLLFASSTVVTTAASGKKLPYDPIRDLVAIGETGSVPFLIVVPPSSSATTLSDLIAQARAKPGTFSYGTGGVATITHLGTEYFASAAKLQLLHVPYKGVGEALPDLMTGRLQLLMPTVAVGLPQIRAGKMRGLAVTSAQRSPLAPEIPTAAEAGLPGFQVEAWWGILGPARLPLPIVKRLNEEINTVLAMPEVRDAMTREGATARSSTPEAFGDMMRSELSRWTRLIKDANIATD
jgi:tripartite-type tricarboxylate transporter receptor subunit TctC